MGHLMVTCGQSSCKGTQWRPRGGFH